jgi:hypothetical protein
MNIPMNSTPNIGVLLISRDREPSLILDRIKDLEQQEFKPTRIISCVKRPEFVEETIKILSENKEKTNIEYNIVQLFDFVHRDLEIVDECYRYNMGYLMVFESNKEIPKNAFYQLNELLQTGNGVFYIDPYKGEELHGMTIHCRAFEKLYGNKPIIHPDGTVDKRTFAERIEELSQVKGVVK